MMASRVILILKQGSRRVRLNNFFGPEDGYDLVIGVPDETPYCSAVTSSGKQNRARSTIQLHFRSESSCNNWSRPDFVDPSGVGEHKQLLQLKGQHQKDLKTAEIPHDNNAHFRWEFREVGTAWWSIPNKFEKSPSTHRGSQNKLPPFSPAWWGTAEVQKYRQPNQRDSGRSSDGVS